MNKIYIKDHANNANRWIYNGYALAWQKNGYEVVRYNEISDIKEENQVVMATDWSIKSQSDLDILKKTKTTFLFVQPTKYEMPWSTHPNFMCFLPQPFIDQLNQMDNIHKWVFTDHEIVDYYFAWNKVHKYPLAFDNISYNNFIKNDKYKYDVCYVGGRAHNGFDEKYKIMMSIFAAFKDSGLKCGFFIEKNLTHEQETNILFNSKVCLNVHDANQLKTNIDTNERTFKGLGINGVLTCNGNGQLSRLFPSVKTGTTPEEIVKIAKELCALPTEQLENIAIENRRNILENHTYTARVKEMVKYV